MRTYLYNILSYPIRKEPWLYASLIALAIISVITSRYRGLLGVAPIISSSVFAYVLTAIVSVMPRYVNAACRCIAIAYSLTLVLLAFFGALFVETGQAFYTLMLILQTNPQETSGFFQHYVHVPQVVMTVGTLALYAASAYAVHWLLTKAKPHVTRCARLVATCESWLMIASLAVLPGNVILGTPQLEILNTNLGVVFANHDLKEYVRLPEIRETSDVHPQNIVLILGESHSRSHSALTGYDKQNNPLLQQLVDSGNLAVFDNVSSPAANTVFAILRIMSTYSDSLTDSAVVASPNLSKDWWECQTMPTTMKAMGYSTYWLTNQRDAATNDAVADSYGHLCDVFERTCSTDCFDGDLLPIIKKHAAADRKKFMVVHLMGSHEEFSQRYPESFARFHAADYQRSPEHQREVMAQYDNSILYNDYVVHSIIQQFADQSAIVVYFPDHGLDIYETDATYAAHAKANPQSQRVACQVPMYVYFSDAYKSQVPGSLEDIRRTAHAPFNTENAIYMLMKLAGYSY